MIIETDNQVEIKYDELATLKQIALEGGLQQEILVSCTDLSTSLNISQQTVSRRLRNLEDSGLIHRNMMPEGQHIYITEAGERMLSEENDAYSEIFESRSDIEINGYIRSGLGKGEDFVTLPGYSEQFQKRLEYDPYPGTLNVELTDDGIRSRTRMEAVVDHIWINGWDDGDKSFGPATCYEITLESSQGEMYSPAHIIIPLRTDHDDAVLEVLASDNLRDELALDDGSEVTLHVAR